MFMPMTPTRVKTFRSIARRLSVRTVAKVFAEFNVPIGVAVIVLATRGSV